MNFFIIMDLHNLSEGEGSSGEEGGKARRHALASTRRRQVSCVQ